MGQYAVVWCDVITDVVCDVAFLPQRESTADHVACWLQCCMVLYGMTWHDMLPPMRGDSRLCDMLMAMTCMAVYGAVCYRMTCFPPVTGDSRPFDVLMAIRTCIVWHGRTWHGMIFPSDRQQQTVWCSDGNKDMYSMARHGMIFPSDMRQQTIWCSDGNKDMYSIAWRSMTWHGVTCFPQWQATADHVTCWWHWGRVTEPQKCARSQKEGLSAGEWLFVNFYCASLIVRHGWYFCHMCWPWSWSHWHRLPGTQMAALTVVFSWLSKVNI